MRRAKGPSLYAGSSKARVKVWIGARFAFCARFATADESTPLDRKTPSGTSLTRWIRRHSSTTADRRSSLIPPLGAGAGTVQKSRDASDRKSTRLNSSHVEISYAV